MEMREREPIGRARRHQNPPEGPSPEGDLSSVRQDAQHFLDAGGQAIEKALSRDSEAFLRASRQRGGQ